MASHTVKQEKIYKWEIRSYPMTEVHIGDMLKTLSEVLDEIKAWLAWEALKQAETSSSASHGVWSESLDIATLKNAYTRFLTLSLQIHCQLADPGCSLGKRQKDQFRQQLRQMEIEVRNRHLSERFINL